MFTNQSKKVELYLLDSGLTSHQLNSPAFKCKNCHMWQALNYILLSNIDTSHLSHNHAVNVPTNVRGGTDFSEIGSFTYTSPDKLQTDRYLYRYNMF